MNKTILFIFLLFLNLHLNAFSSVWKISKNNNHIYLAGTIHALGEKDYPLNKTFYKAYKNSQIIVFETNLQKLADPSFSYLIKSKTRYKKNDYISNYLSKETLSLLKIELKKRKIPYSLIENLKPGIISVILTQNELQRLNIFGIGVDKYFSQKAKKDKKKRLYLETVYKQIDFLSTMGEGYEDDFIKYTLKDLKTLEKDFILMKKAWRQGDNELLEKISLKPLLLNFPKLYDSLLVKRNEKWLIKIKKMFKNKKIEYVLVGALHLVGEQGLLKELERLDYIITRVKE